MKRKKVLHRLAIKNLVEKSNACSNISHLLSHQKKSDDKKPPMMRSAEVVPRKVHTLKFQHIFAYETKIFMDDKAHERTMCCLSQVEN